jgi:hypothetical protein
METVIEKLAKALYDVVDGASWYDIQYNTGLDEERCKEIAALFDKVNKATDPYSGKVDIAKVVKDLQ